MTTKPSDASVVPRVGIGCFVQDARGRVLLGKRFGSHGSGTLALPGGHLELHESFEDCAAREVLEETGIELLHGSSSSADRRISKISVLGAVNSVHMRDLKQDPSIPSRHYVTIFCSGHASPDTQEPENREPDKCTGWAWVPFAWLRAQAIAQDKADQLKEQMEAQGNALPVSADKLKMAQKLAEDMARARHDTGGSTVVDRIGTTQDTGVADASALLTSSEQGNNSSSTGPTTAEEAAEWKAADEFADHAPLFQPLVNCFFQLEHVVLHDLP